jgi:phosphatidylserine/phosphatidylglycerophosphate/cardiolipin synthase-like enzyme
MEKGISEKLPVLLLVVSAALLGASLFFALQQPCQGCNAKVELVLSPGSEGEVVSLIRSAQKTLDVEIYVLTSETIVKELADAEKRGVRVRVLMEARVEDTRKERIFNTLSDLGAEMRWASLTYKLTHSKMIIADGKRALVGSINLSDSALNLNREIAVVLEGEKVNELSAEFEKDWELAIAQQ